MNSREIIKRNEIVSNKFSYANITTGKRNRQRIVKYGDLKNFYWVLYDRSYSPMRSMKNIDGDITEKAYQEDPFMFHEIENIISDRLVLEE